MYLKVGKSDINGAIEIPGSKSHTIRAIFLSSLSDGRSEIRKPLLSDDTVSAVAACRAFGAGFKHLPDSIEVTGFGASPQTPDNIVDIGNSGTTLRFAAAVAGLCGGWTVLTGDDQIRRRPLAPLLDAIRNLGGSAFSTKGYGMAPVVVGGRMEGGFAKIDAVTSQFLSALLISTPLLDKDTTIEVVRLNEVPYVRMTLWWLDKMGVEYCNNEFKTFNIKGKQRYNAFNTVIPGDFSSATFFAVLAAISGGTVRISNLDMNDPQGDKVVLDYLECMGARVTRKSRSVTVQGRDLKGMDIDMNATPDALPAMAVAGCFASGRTRLLNVPQARLKETDRIHVMYEELSKMGARINELPDGLVIERSDLKSAHLSGRFDHRVIMALAIAGLCVKDGVTIDTAEAVNITFPQFTELIGECGGDITIVEKL